MTSLATCFKYLDFMTAGMQSGIFIILAHKCLWERPLLYDFLNGGIVFLIIKTHSAEIVGGSQHG
ncbi:hypothetical protein IJ556_00190 [bacterium]|nr:hypothetical protein [bacterium]